MHVARKFRQIGERVDHVLAVPDWVRRSETNPLNAVDFMDRFQQLRERHLAVNLWKFVPPVKIHDLP